MKTLFKYTLVLLVFTFILVGCTNKQTMTGPKTADQDMNSKVQPINRSADFPLITDGNVTIGTVAVSNDATHLTVAYTLYDNWKLHKTYVHVAANVNGIPINPNGLPVPAQFDFCTIHNPIVSHFTYQIPLADYEFQVGSEIIIAANASVKKGNGASSNAIQETAWAGNTQLYAPQWWQYIRYTLEGPPLVFNTYDAMVRMFDDPADCSYHFPGHPWYSFIVAIPETDLQTFYFYAAGKIKVGEIHIWRNDDFLYTKIVLDSPYEMSESQVNVQTSEYLEPPNFKLFPSIANHEPRATTFRHDLPWDKNWTGLKLFIAVHGKVGPF